MTTNTKSEFTTFAFVLLCTLAVLGVFAGCGSVPAGDPAAEAALANTWTHAVDSTHREVLALHDDGTYVDDDEVLSAGEWTSTGEVLGQWAATASELTRNPTETAPAGPLPQAKTDGYTLAPGGTDPAAGAFGAVLVLNGVQFSAPLPACDVPSGYVLIIHGPNSCAMCGTETIDGYDHRDLVGCTLPGSVVCVADQGVCQ